jgi:hypothetical protein
LRWKLLSGEESLCFIVHEYFSFLMIKLCSKISLHCRSPDSVASAKELFQSTWVADEETCLKRETDLQLKLIATWNQIAAAGRQFGVNLPYFLRKV